MRSRSSDSLTTSGLEECIARKASFSARSSCTCSSTATGTVAALAAVNLAMAVSLSFTIICMDCAFLSSSFLTCSNTSCAIECCCCRQDKSCSSCASLRLDIFSACCVLGSMMYSVLMLAFKVSDNFGDGGAGISGRLDNSSTVARRRTISSCSALGSASISS